MDGDVAQKRTSLEVESIRSRKFVRINLWGDKAELIIAEEGQQIKVLDVTTTDKEKTKKYLYGAVACLQSTSSTTVKVVQHEPVVMEITARVTGMRSGQIIFRVDGEKHAFICKDKGMQTALINLIPNKVKITVSDENIINFR